MAYEKHNWQSGDIIYASQLNEMDEQIKKNEEEQTHLSESITEILTTTKNLYKVKNVTCANPTISVVRDGNFVIINGTPSNTESVQIELEEPIPIGTYNLVPYTTDGLTGNLTVRGLIKWTFATDNINLTDDVNKGVEFKSVNANYIFVQTQGRLFNNFRFGLTISDNDIDGYFEDEKKEPNKDGAFKDIYERAYRTEKVIDSLDNVSKMNYVYVAKNGSNTTGDGSPTKPFATIYHANESITDNSETNRYTIIVRNGTYTDLQTMYSGVGGTGVAQGVICKDYVYYESEDIGNPQNCIISWDGVTGLSDKTRNNIIDKCAFHIQGNTHTHQRI